MRKVTFFCGILVLVLLIQGCSGAISPESNDDINGVNEVVSVDEGYDASYDAADVGVVDIVEPLAGYMYLFEFHPMKVPFTKKAVVIGPTLDIVTAEEGIHHMQFVAEPMFRDTEVVTWDYWNIDGFTRSWELSSGLYTITVTGYNADEQEVASDSVEVLYLKMGSQDFGVWVHTRYDQGVTISQKLDIDIFEFESMLNTGETRSFSASIADFNDTLLDLSFRRTKILGNTERVIETRCDIETLCDTSKSYEVSLEVKFPFPLLDGGALSDDGDSFFTAKVGVFSSTPEEGYGVNKVSTWFYFGRNNSGDPRVFRMHLKPESLAQGSSMTLFSEYHTVSASGDDLFYRRFSVDFSPATEFMITSIPREAKIRYEFGESAGVSTQIAFRAEGGLLDDIVQCFTVDPLPAYMAFDLTLIGAHEIIYESDTRYDITYSLDSLQQGNLVRFEVDGLPKRIAATWGLELDELGDLAASAYAQLVMSDDVDRCALYLKGDPTPFIEFTDVSQQFEFNSLIDILSGVGSVTVYRGVAEPRVITMTLQYDTVVLQQTFELDNDFVELRWDVDITSGQGTVEIQRDTSRQTVLSMQLTIDEWVFGGDLELINDFVQLAWDVDRVERNGHISLSRSAGGSPSISVSVAHDNWMVSDTLVLQNEYVELFWDLPAHDDDHVELGVLTSGNKLLTNTLSIMDDSVEIFQLSCGVATNDEFRLSWDYTDGQITDFAWSGRLLHLDDLSVAINVPGKVFSLSAELNPGDVGLLELEVSEDVSVTFADASTEQFKLYGDISIHGDRKVKVSWDLGLSGEFTVYTFSEPVGDAFNLEFGFDPQHQGNYRYGFRLTGEDFIEITRTIKWYSNSEGELERVWILGDNPLPGDWDLEVLWNYQWYSVPWPT